MNRSLKWMALAGLVCLVLGRAAAEEFIERPANPAQEGHRFLFVVETSAGNRKFENANRQAVFDLIVGGVNGQMRPGDTYGIWTFNEEVKAGEFPVTVWQKEHSLDLAGQAATFLQKQRYAKRTIIQLLVNDLRRLSDRVGDFNVLIVSSGEDPIAGSPFDQDINAAYKSFAKQSSKSGRPLVTTFVVRKGRPVRAGVVLAGDRIILPERPPEAPPKRTPVATKATPASAVSSNSLATAETAPPPPRKKVMQILTKTNTPATTPAVVESLPSTNVTNAASTVAVAPPEPPSNSVPETPSVQAATVPPASAPPLPEPAIAPAPTAPAPVPAPAPAMALALTPVIQSEVQEPTPPVVEPAPKPVAGTTTASSPVLAFAPVASATVSARTPTSSSTLSAPAAGPQNTTAASAVVVFAREPSLLSNTNSQSAEIPLLQGAVVLVRTADGLSAGVLIAIGGTLFGAACFLLILLLRRAPAGARGSLITQAMRPMRPERKM